MTKKVLALSLCVFIFVSFLVGCSIPSGEVEGQTKVTATTEKVVEEGTQPDPVTIEISNWPNQSNESLTASYEKFVEVMNEKFPHVTIVPNEWKYDVNSFLPKAASGQLPTVYLTWFTETDKIINAGYCADITDVMVEYGYDKAINPDILELVTNNERHYGIPRTAYVMGMWYNVNLFKEAGLLDSEGIPVYPGTYDELIETAKTIKQKTGKAGFFYPATSNQGGWFFMSLAWSFGAEFQKMVDGKWTAVFNSPEAVDALQYLKDLKWEHDVLQDNVLVNNNDLFQLFGTDQVAISFGTDDWKNKPSELYEMSKDNLSMSALPAGPGGSIALVGGGTYMFSPNATPEEIDAAIKWLEITGISPAVTKEALTGYEETRKERNENGYIVGPDSLKIWVNEDRLKAEKEIEENYTNVNMKLFEDFIENSTDNIRPEVPNNAQELYSLLDTVIQAVLTDEDADPKELLDKAVEEYQKNYLDNIQ